ncbi:Cytochrome c oxidase, subunit VIb/COX12 [Phaffia rhodozyma]|uniref:Cytochrome c oxidase, subunit VIb/COX12 n=1 Tax=Phaffia rhodozyma TaxID=264483 RepID=A0A0F7SQ68_PHARH|nr:Cytochrome c oxidase, subunit VIb/COX12 [Phaffia rhodozyma]
MSPSSSETPSFPNREARKLCWAARDEYYSCLDSKGAVAPGSEGKACGKEKDAFEGSCVRSWIDYFNKRRVLEAGLRARLLEDQAKGIDVSGLRYGPDDPKKNFSSRG